MVLDDPALHLGRSRTTRPALLHLLQDLLSPLRGRDQRRQECQQAGDRPQIILSLPATRAGGDVLPDSGFGLAAQLSVVIGGDQIAEFLAALRATGDRQPQAVHIAKAEAGAMDKLPGVVVRAFQGAGELVVGQVMDLAQHQCLTIDGRQAVKRAADQLLLLGASRLLLGRTARRGRLRHQVGVLEIHQPAILANLVDRQIAGDPEDPGLEVVRGTETRQTLVGDDEGILGHVLRRRAVAQDLVGVVEDGRVEGLEQVGEGLLVPGLCLPGAGDNVRVRSSTS